MATKPKMLPHFESEEEELKFWETHHPADYIEGPADIIIRLKKRPKKTVTLRMDEALYDDLRTAADRHEVPYQSLMQALLRKALHEFVASERPSRPARRRVTAATASATTP